MAEEDRPPTYEELMAQRDALLAENKTLRARSKKAGAELDRLRDAATERPKPARRQLDKDAPSELNRPWDGR